MPALERKFIEFIEKHISILYFAAIVGLAFYIRLIGRHFLSEDMRVFLLSWYDQMKEAGGFSGLKEQIGDYNILYQTFIALMTYIPLNPMTMFKAFSIIFDFLMAFTAAFFVSRSLDRPLFGRTFNAVLTAVLFMPSVALNSAYWGQCDSMYAFCMLIAVCLLYKDKHLLSFLFLGLSFAFKLQTIIIVPFFLACYLVKKRFTIMMFAVSLISFWGSGIVAYIFGRDLLAPFQVYIDQTSTYKSMYMNSRSIWLVFGNEYPDFGAFAIMLSVALCGIGIYMIASKRVKLDKPGEFFAAASYFAWTCIFFLPNMHERYAYPLDILLVVTAFFDRRYIRFAVFSGFLSFMAYAPFLVHANGLGREDAFIELFVYAWFTYTVLHSADEKKPETQTV